MWDLLCPTSVCTLTASSFTHTAMYVHSLALSGLVLFPHLRRPHFVYDAQGTFGLFYLLGAVRGAAVNVGEYGCSAVCFWFSAVRASVLAPLQHGLCPQNVVLGGSQPGFLI